MTADPLADAFEHDLECRHADAVRLAAIARRWGIGGAEDSAEDLVVRLRDPQVFGDFAARCVRDVRLRGATRVRMAERAFDLLPLPSEESEVLVVEGRAPRSILRLVEFLGAHRALTMVHVLHTVFAVFLDRTLVTDATAQVRARAFARMAVSAREAESSFLLYAAMHLAVVPPVEGLATISFVLRSQWVADRVKDRLARLAAEADGGTETWLRVAKAEGLIAADTASDSPAGIANAPRIPDRVREVARRWLARRER